MLEDLPADIAAQMAADRDPVRYWYQDRDPFVGDPQRLPRTAAAEALGRLLSDELEAEFGPGAHREGKMYGVLIVEDAAGKRGWLKAFSGLLEGSAERLGWVPTIPGRDSSGNLRSDRVALLEAQTLSQLEALKLELIALKGLPQRGEYERLSQGFVARLREMGDRHRENKAERRARREQPNPPNPPLTKGGFEAGEERQGLLAESAQGAEPLADRPLADRPLEDQPLADQSPPLKKGDRGGFLAALEEESRRDKRERRSLKQERDQVLAPLKAAIAQADAHILRLKRQRKALSQQLQTEMHRAYSLQNFAGEAVSLNQLGLSMGKVGLPTGTGECCAPKLLHYAASQGLKPLAMAEFWWGAAVGDRQSGQFYGACEERCQPLMGFLLGGLDRLVQSGPKAEAAASASEDLSLPILYEDDWIIAVDKPAGLLSVPGRSRQNQDSVLSRLRNQLRDDQGQRLGEQLRTVHRLDQDTSGILLLAKDAASQRHLQQQFQQQHISKTYEAILQGQPMIKGGSISLPLAADPEHRPCQRVDHETGKPSQTRFIVLERKGGVSRVRFEPVTGRTHQLRVHAAAGLGMAIVGDRLYGTASAQRSDPATGDRLYLHACRLRFCHPVTGEEITLRSPVPF